ncbi:unnamed protein product [Angiostrongylus costaricensis]|uniref:P53 domain-containing protein n=1 Tax=Angiostrongylus costaricensis TaxID=334426 RepID=A0A0R3Q2A0_ANGCS|nr:unnamed protein product [Angiostrongylus costaricensis]
MEKLYCKIGTVVPITFNIVGERDPRSRIRVRAVYTDHAIFDTPVVPCPNHLAKDASNARNHFVRCQHAGTEYLDENGNYSLRIPLCEQAGFMFTCFSSCAGGINRRSVALTFQLELGGGRSSGMHCLPLKVCAKPYRDAYLDDKKMLETAFMKKTPKRKKQHSSSKPSPNSECNDNTSGALEIRVKLNDPTKINKCLWYLRHEEKFDSLISMAMDNISSRDFCSLTPGIGIKAWLSRPSIGLASHADRFERNSITTLGDLAKIYRNDTFARFGFTPNECAVLNKAFQEWHHEYRLELWATFPFSKDVEVHAILARIARMYPTVHYFNRTRFLAPRPLIAIVRGQD